MKKKILLSGLILLLLAVGYYIYEMWGFAKGVNEDTKRRNELLKENQSQSDSLQLKDTTSKN